MHCASRIWRDLLEPPISGASLAADALIASTYLAGTKRVRRALAALFGGTVGKDTVSRAWRRVKSDWDVWNTRSLAEDPIVRLILDGAVGSRSLGYSGRIPPPSGAGW